MLQRAGTPAPWKRVPHCATVLCFMSITTHTELVFRLRVYRRATRRQQQIWVGLLQL